MAYRKQVYVYIAIFFFSFLLWACTKSLRADPPSAHYFIITLGQEFELKKGQRARAAGTGFELAVLNFFNQPCPTGVKCVWSGIGIEFEYRYNGQLKKGINLVRAFGYRTDVIRSDYDSYAILRITQDKDS